MKKPILLITITVALAGCTTGGGGRPESSEPIYRGKSLSGWVTKLDAYDVNRTKCDPSSDGVKAIRAIGPVAITYLLEWLMLPEQPRPMTGLIKPHELPTKPQVAVAFKILGEAGKPAIPELEKIVSVPPPQVFGADSAYICAAQSLSFLGPEAAPAMIRAATSLQDSDPSDELFIIEQIGWMGANGEAAVPSLIRWASATNASIRRTAVESVGQIGRKPELVIPVLITALKDTDAYVSRQAASSLGEFKGNAKEAIPDLIRFLDDPKWQTRKVAIRSLGKIGGQPDVVVPLLILQLKDEDFAIRASAATALGDMGGKAAFDALLQSTDDPDKAVRESVFASLKKIDPKALKKSGKVAH